MKKIILNVTGTISEDKTAALVEVVCALESELRELDFYFTVINENNFESETL